MAPDETVNVPEDAGELALEALDGVSGAGWPSTGNTTCAGQ